MSTTVIIILAAGALLVAYLLGRIHQQTKDESRLVAAGLGADAFPDVAVEMPSSKEVEAQMAAIEVVGYLDMTTAPLKKPSPLLPPPPRYGERVEYKAPVVVPELVVPLGDVPLLAARADAARWQERYLRAERLRGRYLRLLRVERARLHYMLGDVMDAPRRPRKLSLVAVQVEVGRRHLSLVPPVKAREWREAAA